MVVGDIHGCFREFMALLEKIKYDSAKDKLYCLGDLLDRGPESARVVKWVREANQKTNGMVQCVLGNHDEKYFRWFKHTLKLKVMPNYRIPMHPLDAEKHSIFNAMSEEDLNFLGSLPTFVHLENQDWVIVHAGLEPRKHLDDQDVGKLTHIRYLDPRTMRTVSLGRDLMPPDGSIYWTDVYDLPHHVVYGHNVHNLEHPRIFKNASGRQLVGLDTGCCFGGRLSAFFVPESKEEQVTPDNFVQVDAFKMYAKNFLSRI